MDTTHTRSPAVKVFSAVGFAFLLFVAAMTCGFIVLSWYENYSSANPWFHISTFAGAFFLSVLPWVLALVGGAVTRSRKWAWITLGLTLLAFSFPPLIGLPGVLIGIIVIAAAAALRPPRDWHVCNRDGPSADVIDESGQGSPITGHYPTCSVCKKPQVFLPQPSSPISK